MTRSNITIRGYKIFLNSQHIASLHGDTIHVGRDKSVHTFNKHKSFGFNETMVEEISFKYLQVNCTDGSILKTTKNYLLANARIEECNNQDRQLHLPLNRFGLDKVKQWEEDEYLKAHPDIAMEIRFGLRTRKEVFKEGIPQ